MKTVLPRSKQKEASMLSPGLPLVKSLRVVAEVVRLRPKPPDFSYRLISRLSSFRTILFCSCWLLILLAAAYDAYFAWRYRLVLSAWEMNPFILWLASVGGIASVLVVKLFSMILSTGVAAICHLRRHRLEIPLTLVIGCAYFALSFHYMISFWKS